MVEKHKQCSSFTQCAFTSILCLIWEAGLEYMAKECRILLRQLLEHVPHFNAFAKLLICHYDNGHKVGVGGFVPMIMWPQILLQVLAELEHVDPACTVLPTHFFSVNALNDFCIERQVLLLRFR